MTRAALLIALTACGSSSAAPDAAPSDTALDSPADSTSCVHVPGAPTAIGAVDGLPSNELSGIAASHATGNLVWALGDHGSAAELYAIGTANASLRGTLRLTDATNIDWEDLAAAPCGASHCLYVADLGDNDLDRVSISLYEVVEPAAAPIGAVDIAATRYDIQYPDGPHNAEALFVDPRDGAAYAITKVETTHPAVYHLPRTSPAPSSPSPATAQHIADLTIPGAGDPRITSADLTIDACGARLLLRTYDALFELRASSTASIATLLAASLATMPVATEPHGEAVTFAADGRAYYTISEGTKPTLYRVAD